VIPGDLDAELIRALSDAPNSFPRGTWRPAPSHDPASYATSLAFGLSGDPPAIAAALAGQFSALPWVRSAEPSGGGYLTVTVTSEALATVAPRTAAAGVGCARSDILRGTQAELLPWPDLESALSWRQAWDEQAAAMTGRLAQCAGATLQEGKRGRSAAPRHDAARSPVQAEAAYLGADAVRYRLARTLPGRVAVLGQPTAGQPDRLAPVQLAHAESASVLRWAGDLGLGPARAALLGAPEERSLLGLLSWVQVRVAAAARIGRPAEVPRYLEEVAAAWASCRLVRPALLFHGEAAPADPAVAGARLMLADATRAVLAAGLELTGIAPRERI